jgi:predicted nucleic acid-binding protein
MTTYYVDTSALVKRYIDEVGSDWLRAELNTSPPPSLLVVHLAIVEITSALTRRMREGILTLTEYAQVQNAFRSDCLNEYQLIIAVDNIIDRANRLLESHPLRAYDAIHLAAAVVANQKLLTNTLAPLIFLSADDRLNQAATAAGLVVDNPAHHP